MAEAAHRHGHNPSYNKRSRPLRVQGVGNGALRSCNYVYTLPIALKQKDKSVALGKLLIPTVSGSDLPGLLGPAALRKNRGILDLNTVGLALLRSWRLRLAKSIAARYRHFSVGTGTIWTPCVALL